jgi:6-pyruvoyltetrahydropterin/6-carboxytetrahydropterin synthase
MLSPPAAASPLAGQTRGGVGETMFRVTREIDFCYGHRLLNYEGKCRYLHGHNGRAVISIESDTLDQRAMVLDFAEIKQTVQHWIDQNLDHRMILHRLDPVVPALRDLGEPMYLVETNPTAETIAKLIFDVCVQHGFPVVETHLWETPHCFASYRQQGEKKSSPGGA